jgi:hypothetical protein
MASRSTVLRTHQRGETGHAHRRRTYLPATELVVAVKAKEEREIVRKNGEARVLTLIGA